MIEIKYYGGEMLMDPKSYFDSKNATIGKFRKLVRMSLESDRIYNTKATEAWAEAVDSELYFLSDTIKAEKDSCITIKANLRKLENQKRKLEKFKEILSSYCTSCGN